MNKKWNSKERHLELRIDIDSLEIPSLDVYKHFNIFDDLFRKLTYFDNVQNIDITFNENNVVYNGNTLTPSTVSEIPQIEIEKIGKPGYNTLLMANLDGNGFVEENGEFIQYLVANIGDGEKVTSG